MTKTKTTLTDAERQRIGKTYVEARERAASVAGQCSAALTTLAGKADAIRQALAGADAAAATLGIAADDESTAGVRALSAYIAGGAPHLAFTMSEPYSWIVSGSDTAAVLADLGLVKEGQR